MDNKYLFIYCVHLNICMNLLHLKLKCFPFYSLFRENVLHFEVNVPSLTIPFEIFCHNGTIIILSLTTSYQDTLLPSIYILLKVYIVQIYTLRKYIICHYCHEIFRMIKITIYRVAHTFGSFYVLIMPWRSFVKSKQVFSQSRLL